MCVGKLTTGGVREIQSGELHHVPYSFNSVYFLNGDNWRCNSLIVFCTGIPYVLEEYQWQRKKTSFSVTFLLC